MRNLQMTYLIYFLLGFFVILIVYQFLNRGIREGLIAKNPCIGTGCSYSTDDAFQDLTEQDSRITNLETLLDKNSKTIADLLKKANSAVGGQSAGKESFLVSQKNQKYTEDDENADVLNQNKRILSLQIGVKKCILDIAEINRKLNTPPTNTYSEPETGNSLVLPKNYANNKEEIVAHEKAITVLEQLVKENATDIDEIQNQIKKEVDKKTELINKITASPPPTLTGLK